MITSNNKRMAYEAPFMGISVFDSESVVTDSAIKGQSLTSDQVTNIQNGTDKSLNAYSVNFALVY